MKTHLFPALLLLAALAAAAAAPATEPIDAKAAFERLKTLAGEWRADSKTTGEARLSIEVIAHGASIVQRESFERMPGMLTVYHLDGDRLLLTHYCMLGNQPRLEARSFDAKTGELRFEFLDGTNMKPADNHVHNVAFRLAGEDAFAADWEFFQNGRLAVTEPFQYTRIR